MQFVRSNSFTQKFSYIFQNCRRLVMITNRLIINLPVNYRFIQDHTPLTSKIFAIRDTNI